jgi:hypothetical protein
MAENIFTFVSGDTSIAQQYLSTFRRSEHLEPEKALLAAILEDAIHECRKYRRARDPEGEERFHAAEGWILDDSDDWIFAFRNVCELLGLDPAYVRRGLRESISKARDAEKPASRRDRRKRAA